MRTVDPSAGAAANAFARGLFRGLPARYDLLAEVLSLGQNARWRQAMIAPVVAVGPDSVLDVATGTAGVALQLAAHSDATVTGIDLTEEMLRHGQKAIARRDRAERIRLVVGRGEQLPFPDASFDALTFTYLLRYVEDPTATLRELARVVRPGGTVASLEFHVPTNPVWHALWWLYTRLGLPAVGALGGRPWYEVGRFLGPSISRHYRDYPLVWTLDAWRHAGIDDVEHRVMSLGAGVAIWGRKRDG